VAQDVRVGTEVDVLQHRDLSAPQPVGVGDLERSRVPQGRKPAFGAVGELVIDDVVRSVEERLELVLGQTATPGATASSVVCRGAFQSKTT
jgi:hypothetical protein